MEPEPLRAVYGRLARACEMLSDANFSAAVACLRKDDCTPARVVGLSASLSQQAQRGALQRMAEAWEKRAPDLTGRELAAALVALREADRREAPPEIAWSGPTSKTFTYRTTQELIHEMIDGAEQRLLIVSYAVSEVGSLRVHSKPRSSVKCGSASSWSISTPTTSNPGRTTSRRSEPR